MPKSITKEKQIRKKHLGGRPTKYLPEYPQMLVDYFDIEPVNYKDVTYTYKNGDTRESSEEEASQIPFLSSFAKSIGITHDTLLEWVKVYPEFSVAYKRAKKLQMEFLMVNGLRGNYSAPFTIFTLKNVSKWRDIDDGNWADKQEVEHVGNVQVTYNRKELLRIIHEVRVTKEAIKNGV